MNSGGLWQPKLGEDSRREEHRIWRAHRNPRQSGGLEQVFVEVKKFCLEQLPGFVKIGHQYRAAAAGFEEFPAGGQKFGEFVVDDRHCGCPAYDVRVRSPWREPSASVRELTSPLLHRRFGPEVGQAESCSGSEYCGQSVGFQGGEDDCATTALVDPVEPHIDFDKLAEVRNCGASEGCSGTHAKRDEPHPGRAVEEVGNDAVGEEWCDSCGIHSPVYKGEIGPELFENRSAGEGRGVVRDWVHSHTVSSSPVLAVTNV